MDRFDIEHLQDLVALARMGQLTEDRIDRFCDRVDKLIAALCARIAQWRHPLGGLRCNSCPKPRARKEK